MFMLNSQPLVLDTSFTVGEGDAAIHYPSNWLRLASAEERAAIGITEVPDTGRADDRFYWNGDINQPKDLTVLKAMMHREMSAAAYSLLFPTDYKLVRKVETGLEVDSDTINYRAAVRDAHQANVDAVDACTTVAELAALARTWPSQA